MSKIEHDILDGERGFCSLKSSLIPKIGHPFFIVTPPYIRASTDIFALHLLCHYLNILGESAFIVYYPAQRTAIRSLPGYCTAVEQTQFPAGMQTPILTQNALEFYDKKRLTPIVIYPEIYNNPLNAPFWGRYILNFPERFGDKYEEVENFSFAYTKTLADLCTTDFPDHPPTEDVLFVPTCDLGFWNANGAAAQRRGTCYYGTNLKDEHGEQPKTVPNGSIEIRREKMTHEKIREIFWKSEAFYSCEDTELAIQAVLCGCPTVHVPNRYYSGVSLAQNELGADGTCLVGDTEGLARARRTAANLRQTMRAHIAKVPPQIGRLAARWKAMAEEQEYRGTITSPFETLLVYLDQHGPDVPAQPDFATTDGVGCSLPESFELDSPRARPLSTRQSLAAVLLAVKRSVAYRSPLATKVLRAFFRVATRWHGMGQQ